jgi:hypothetical protein
MHFIHLKQRIKRKMTQRQGRPNFQLEVQQQCSGRGSTNSGTGRFAPFYVPRTTPGAQPSIRSVLKKKEKKEADKVVGRCLFWSDIPLNITKNNPFCQPMCDAIVVVGPRYKSPTFEELQGPILQEEKKDINSRLAKFKQSWEISGCTVMSDGWIDRCEFSKSYQLPSWSVFDQAKALSFLLSSF